MTANGSSLHEDRFEEIGQIVSTEAELITDIWCQRAVAEQNGKEVSHRAELKNAFPEFLLSLGASLKQRGNRLEFQRERRAIDHGRQRWQNGWRLEDVVGDYQLLRLTLLEYLDQRLPRPLTLKEVLAVGLLLDDAIGTAVVTYVDYQETHLDQARQLAENSSEAKSHFVAKVSHEIRTPMTAILGLTELALEEPLSPQLEDFLTTAHDSAKSLLNLLNDILDLSKIEVSRLELDSTEFDLRQLFEDVVRQQGMRASSKGLELILDVSPDLPKFACGDPLRLRQILLNLLSNAIKFTDQGEVVVRAFHAIRETSTLVLTCEVSDTGIGISVEDQTKIFAPFAQVDTNAARMFGGSGLGLAIATELVARMGGKLWVHSEVGSGSLFSFDVRLRVASASIGHLSPDVQSLKPLQGNSLLIVDDNTTNRARLRTLLESWGADVEESESGPRAIELVRERLSRQREYAWILVDALMPGMDGFTTIGELQKVSQGASQKIVMLNVTDRSTFNDRLQDIGVGGTIDKPILDSDLAAVLCGQAKAFTRPGTIRAAALDPPSRAYAVLLVEDTPANQKLVRAILARRGHLVTVAHNGREALDQLTRQPFDVVLMDVQMPTMDGFQATALIRKREVESNSRTPIVAMTASSMCGDAEKCIGAGMDAYLSKPIETTKLIEIVERMAAKSGSVSEVRDRPLATERVDHAIGTDAQVSRNALARAGELKKVNLDCALIRLGGERTLLQDLIGFFEVDAPELVEHFEAAIRERNAAQASRAAHSLKGQASSFDAGLLEKIAMRLETLATERAWDDCLEQLPQLKLSVQDVILELKKFRP